MNKNDAIGLAMARAKENPAFLRALVAKSHYLFGKVFFSEAMYEPSAPFHREMFDLAERGPGVLAVAAFRGSGKSLVFTHSYPLFASMAQGKHFILIFSGTQQQAQQHLMNIRASLEQNELLKKIFGPFREESDEWGRNSLVIPGYDTKIMAVSVEQSVRGLKYKHWRPQLLIADDIEDVSSVRTQEGRDKIFHYVQSEIIPLGGPGTRIIVVGNLLHPDSAIMRIKEAIGEGKMDGEFRMYPLEGDDLTVSWPDRFTPDVLAAERKKYADDIDWEREMNLRFVSAPDTVVRREWISYYDRPPNGAYVAKFVMGVDPANSERQSADCTAIVSAIVCNSGEAMKLFLYPDPFNGRVDFPKAVDEIRRRHDALAASLRPVEVFIEDVAYQAALPQHLRSVSDMRVTGFKLPHDKRGRFAIVGHLIKLGKIVFPEKGCEPLIEQLVGFGKERHDDLCDALAIIAFSAFPDARSTFIFPADDYVDPGTEEDPMVVLKDPKRRAEYERRADREAIGESMAERGRGGWIW